MSGGLATGSAHEAARHLIRPYVERGDSLASLRDGYMGATAPHGYSVSIGGYIPIGGKRYSSDWILVYRDMEGHEVNRAYPIKQIYDELLHGQQQLVL